ncbi:Uma2 family endonuclease [Spirosoma rhododendri]|uniref:Uma2 family endonuclease n=1 Tax=Spirosoma rhododendri TaxID=2728024 RepID=A0A7L5DT98_9BACT|nr:Uma2 family endonuclease [Spirosoma rhododendri]QJD80513.1 Uma2 family endonuclease [Spirosoma rhododendri]
MLAADPNHTPMTIDEYLLREEKSEVRHEFYDGHVYAMAGDTVNHNRLIDNAKDSLKSQVRKRGCQVFFENMKVDVMQGVYMPYPDVVLTCHPFDLRGDDTVVRQPRLLIEVLSKSTASQDRGFKWLRYRRMLSLWYYMLIDQYSTTVELFSRVEETDEWINTVYEHLNDVIVLPRLNCELPLADIYADIELIPEHSADTN